MTYEMEELCECGMTLYEKVTFENDGDMHSIVADCSHCGRSYRVELQANVDISSLSEE